jgi:hypothetical protein
MLGSEATPAGGDARLEVATAVFDQTGRLVTARLDAVTPRPSAGKGGLSMTRRLPLKPGLYQIRVGAHDLATGRIGTAAVWTEVPDLSKKRFAMSDVILTGAGGARPGRVERGIRYFLSPRDVEYSFGVYNPPALREGDRAPVYRVEIVAGERTIYAGDWQSLAPHVVGRDAKGLVVAGELALANTSPGIYDVWVTVRDPASGQTEQHAASFGVAR